MTNPFFNKHEGRLRCAFRLAAQVILMLGLIQILPSFVASLIPQLFGAEAAKEILSFDCTQFIVAFVAMAGTVCLSARWLDRRKLGTIGLAGFKTSMPEYLFGFVLSVFAVGIMFFIEFSLGMVEIKTYSISRMTEPRFLLGILDGFFACAMIGFHEELLRFYQIKNIGEGLSGIPKIGARNALIIAAVLASIFFGYLHKDNNAVTLPAILLLCADGFFLALAYLLTGRGWLAFGYHAGWDFAEGNLFGFPVSGYPEKYSLISLVDKGPAFISGGLFGPDGGLIDLVMIAFGTTGILGWIYFRKKNLRLKLDLANYEHSETAKLEQQVHK